MPTEIKLHHFGEILVARILHALARNLNSEIQCVRHTNCSLESVLTNQNIDQELEFKANVQLNSTIINAQEIIFDGSHGIDVLCIGQNNRALAFEIKLGLDRMSFCAFTNRFLNPITVTDHASPRIKGNMIAILNYRTLGENHVNLSCQFQNENPQEIVPSWFLVIRRQVWNQWVGNVPALSQDAHIVIFEDLVQTFGGEVPFNNLVYELIGNDFYQDWTLGNFV